MSEFSADARPVLIGSLPHKSHQEAVDLIFDYTPQIPLWPQLPHNKKEGMLLQFLPGMPGVTEKDDKIFIDVEGPDFEAQFLSFYEEYIMVTEGGAGLEDSRFSMSNDEAAGFFTFLEKAKKESDQLLGLKGQLTGPITFCTGLVDQDGKALFYNEQIRDAAVKLLALKAQWQTRKMAEIKPTPLVFFDEPGLAGLGSSAFITITPEDIHNCFSEVFSAVREEGGLTGVHVCANTEWPIIFDSGVDIVSFDAFSYFDKLVLYPEQLLSFFGRGGILASGIVPTTTDFIEAVDSEGLTRKWLDQAAQLEELGIAREVIKAQTLITPSCGTGTISEELAVRVLELTRDVSRLVQERYQTSG
jgi:methionine synthase II (cobalamin-independent)